MKNGSVVRIGDMHHSRALKLLVERDGDVILLIEQDGMCIGGTDIGKPEEHIAEIHFNVSGGRSRHTLAALRHLVDAMKRDNAENPITT